MQNAFMSPVVGIKNMSREVVHSESSCGFCLFKAWKVLVRIQQGLTKEGGRKEIAIAHWEHAVDKKRNRKNKGLIL